MDIPGASDVGAGERMAHHLPAAEDEPGPSGRPGSAEHLREGAHLRFSHNGTELLPTADDLIAQEDNGGRRASGLRPRPPTLAVPGGPVPSTAPVTTPIENKSRRISIAGFLGFGPGTPKGDKTAADITLQGSVGQGGMSMGRMRRGSFLHSFGLGGSPSVAPSEHAPDSAAASVADGGAATDGEGARSVGGFSQGRRRRASMLDIFRTSHPALNTSESIGVPGLGTDGVSPSGPELIRSKSSVGSRKSRRASVMDFFRSSNTGLRGSNTGLTEAEGGGASFKGASRSFRGEGAGSQRARRRSVIDVLGHTSRRVFAKLVNHEFIDDDKSEEEVDEGPLWFTALTDFKPLTFKYLTGRYSSAFFACSVKTGEHYILKQFEKDKMSLADERGVRRALAFAQMLEHAHLVRCCGTWEDETALYIVEEYATKGDLLQDSMSHPEKYSEAFMATKVVKPLLEVLVYLHNINVVHRAIFPEYVMFGREDILKLGHFTSAVDQRLDPPNERIHFLDYMAPEMLAVRDEHPVAVHGGIRHNGPHQTKVVRMAGFSNDGGSNATTQHSLNVGYDAAASPGLGGPSLYSPGQGDCSSHASRLVSPLKSPSRRGIFSSITGADAPWLTGAPATSEGGGALGPNSNSPRSARSGGRSPFNIFRSSRQPSSALDRQPSRSIGGVIAASGDGVPPSAMSPLRSPSRRLPAGSPAASGADAPWLVPEGSSARSFTGRRRKSALEEMDAPWLRPLDSTVADDPAAPAPADAVKPPSALDDGPLAGTAVAVVAGAGDGGGASGSGRHGDPRAPCALPGSPGSGGEGTGRDSGELARAAAEAASATTAAAAVAVAGPAGGALSPPRPASAARQTGSAADVVSGGASRPTSATKPPAGSRPTSAAPKLPRGSRPNSAASKPPPNGTPTPPPSGPGPVAESLFTEASSSTPLDVATAQDSASPLKRGRTGVYFTAGVSAGEEALSPPSPPAEGARSRAQSAARSRAASRGASRVQSREGSMTAGAGNMMAGLRTMARNITLRIGQVLVGRGDAHAGPPAEGGGEEGEGGGTARRGGADPSPRQSQAGGGGDTSIFVPSNPWEWQDHYNEKVDCWQVGCLVHEILCNSLPFEAEDKLLACALILWADIVSFPDTLSPECHAFMRACLNKNPAERPSAAELLQHPWITKHAEGEVLKSVKQLKEDQNLHHGVGVDGQQLTTLQRVAVAVGLGWMLSASTHVVAPGAADPAAGATPIGPFAWLRRWTAKVMPGGGGGGDTSKEGNAKFENALHMVQEQHQHETEAVLGHPGDAVRPKSSDVEAGAAAGARRHSLDAHHAHITHAAAPGAAPSTDARWGVVL